MASAVDNSSSTGSPSASGASSPKHIPVAREVQVIATGARPGDSSQKRELFTEATGTVLISEIGGVIRLSAAVATGQLLYLTNQETQQEVVAQVIQKRSFRPTSCYVELEFTEPAPGFWGPPEVLMETTEATAPNTQHAEAAEMVESAEATDEGQSPVKVVPSAQAVERLKNEVETLRHQVKNLTQAKPGDGQPAVAGIVTEEKLFSAKADSASNRALPKLKLPGDVPAPVQEEAFSEEDLLPKPALDFSQMPTELNNSSGLGLGMRGLRILKMVLAILVVAAGVAWFTNFIPGVPTPQNLFATIKKAIPAKVLKAEPPSATVPEQKTEIAGSAKSDDKPGEAKDGEPSTSSPVDASKNEVKPEEERAHENSSPASAKEKSNASVKTSQIAEEKKGEGSHPAASFTDVAPKMPQQHGPLIPPKLLQKVRPVAPPEAIRGYVTGNVDLDVLVGETGEVRSAKVLSGADVLRAAAVTAVKQYKYQPASQDGKPVATHTNVTVQFWYEP